MNGVLLVNLGTPDAPTPSAVRRYLRAFLSDKRVVEVPRLIWKVILEGLVLPLRPPRVAKAYAAVWRRDTDESPLRYFTRRQAEGLLARLRVDNRRIEVAWAMRYGAPSIAEGLAALRAAGCQRIVLMPLYPQYSATTTATVFDATAAHLATLRDQPALTTVRDFHLHPAYIAALAASLAKTPKADYVLASFHGLPERNVALGDPYETQCRATGEALRRVLQLSPKAFGVAFQSQFGRQKWIGPSTQVEVARLAGVGVRRLTIIAPGFLADCLETLEEIQVEIRDLFLAAGGEVLTYVPCLNDGVLAIDLLEAVTLEALGQPKNHDRAREETDEPAVPQAAAVPRLSA